jgi:GNAT superfamily N-acetyltransferase
MPWVIRDVVRDINRSVARRWRSLDPLLPVPDDLPEGCSSPLVVTSPDGRPAALGVCRHQRMASDSLARTWGATHRFMLTTRIKGGDTQHALDGLLAQWRAHVVREPEASDPDSAAIVSWPSRDVTGVRALQRHGLIPMAVVAARQPRPVPGGVPVPGGGSGPVPVPGRDGLVIRPAGPADFAAVTEMEMGVVTFDTNFGGSVPRSSTASLLRADVRARLDRIPTWTWLAERDRSPVGLVSVQPPHEATWVRPLTCVDHAAYLQTGFVAERERGGGTGSALVRHVHAELDRAGIGLTLLHYAQVNPLSAPFWSRQGYRPLWTIWEVRPAGALR